MPETTIRAARVHATCCRFFSETRTASAGRQREPKIGFNSVALPLCLLLQQRQQRLRHVLLRTCQPLRGLALGRFYRKLRLLRGQSRCLLVAQRLHGGLVKHLLAVLKALLIALQRGQPIVAIILGDNDSTLAPRAFGSVHALTRGTAKSRALRLRGLALCLHGPLLGLALATLRLLQSLPRLRYLLVGSLERPFQLRDFRLHLVMLQGRVDKAVLRHLTCRHVGSVVALERYQPLDC